MNNLAPDQIESPSRRAGGGHAHGLRAANQASIHSTVIPLRDRSVRAAHHARTAAKPILVAIFTDGSTVETTTKTRATAFAWCAAGRLRNGKSWRLHGCSASEPKAHIRMEAATRHIKTSGGVRLFAEVQPLRPRVGG